jgi:hypothetical protein
VRARTPYAANLAVSCATVLGAGLVVAALHGGSPTTTNLAPVAYRPPAVAPAPAPTGTVHTTSGTPANPARTATPRRAAPVRPAPARVAKPAAPVVRRTGTSVRTSTFQQALDAAIARIPTYRAGTARWVVTRAYAFWGTADWYHDVLYVSPDVPTSKLYDVAVHEWSHELSVLDYDGDVAAATKAMNAWFGGSDLTGAERAADCMAILQGAHWTHYTTCTNATWRAGAAKLVAGERL